MKRIDFSAFAETSLESIALPDSAESFDVGYGDGLPDVITYKGKIYTGYEFYDIVTRGRSFDNSGGQASSQNPNHLNDPLSDSTCPRCGREITYGNSCDCTWCDICNAWMLGHGHGEGEEPVDGQVLSQNSDYSIGNYIRVVPELNGMMLEDAK